MRISRNYGQQTFGTKFFDDKAFKKVNKYTAKTRHFGRYDSVIKGLLDTNEGDVLVLRGIGGEDMVYPNSTSGKNSAYSFKVSQKTKEALHKITKIKSRDEELLELTMKEDAAGTFESLKAAGSSALAEDFVSKKQKLIRELSNVCDKNVLEQMGKAGTPEQFAGILAKQEMLLINNTYKAILDGQFLTREGIRKSITLDLEQVIHKSRKFRNNFILAREKAMYVPSAKPQVIEIENILKEQYGGKFVSLKDNENLAKKVLKACETAAKNNIDIPENIIVSDFMVGEGENLFNGTMLLNSTQKNAKKGDLSTNRDFHIPLHEILHGEHPVLFAFFHKKIPDRFQQTKNKLSSYSAISQIHETFAELKTKKLLDGLNDDEQALYDYLDIFRGKA